MTAAAIRRGRPGESGLLFSRGCCIGVVVLLLLCAAALVLQVRMTAVPELGAAPVGPSDGSNSAAIATALARRVATQLIQTGAAGAVVLLSERDLTTLAAQYNPDPESFTDVAVRARGGQLWVSADHHLGPLPVVVTARVSPVFQPGGSLDVDIQEIDVGDQAIPGFMQSAVDPRGSAVVSLNGLLNSTALDVYGLECVSVVPNRGIELGFHAPLRAAETGYCAAHPLAAG